MGNLVPRKVTPPRVDHARPRGTATSLMTMPVPPTGAMAYSSTFEPDAPWGYWLVPVADEAGEIVYHDTDGRRWPSVRQAFWCGRLCMSSFFLVDELLDVILDTLADIDGSVRRPGGVSSETDRFLQLWLNSVGMAHHGREPLPLTELSEEGKAVLMMLRATKRRRPVSGWTPLQLHQQALHASILSHTQRNARSA